jgi:hypothetical protein
MGTDIDLLDLLGRLRSEAEVISIFDSLQETPLMSKSNKEVHEKFPKAGLEFIFDLSERIDTIIIYSGVSCTTERIRSQFSRYGGSLPLDLTFDMKRSDVTTILGEPNKVGGGESVPVLGRIFPWIKYEFVNFSIHMQFGESDAMNLMTCSLMR